MSTGLPSRLFVTEMPPDSKLVRFFAIFISFRSDLGRIIRIKLWKETGDNYKLGHLLRWFAGPGHVNDITRVNHRVVQARFFMMGFPLILVVAQWGAPSSSPQDDGVTIMLSVR